MHAGKGKQCYLNQTDKKTRKSKKKSGKKTVKKAYQIMLAEVAAAISAVKAINDSIAAIKEAGQNASGLGIIIEKFAKANDAVQSAETKHAGKLSVAESTQIQIAKKRLNTFNQQLKDMMLMQGLSSDYAEIMQRVEDSKLAHEREVARIKKKRAEVKKMLSLAASVAFLWVALMGMIWLFITIYRSGG